MGRVSRNTALLDESDETRFSMAGGIFLIINRGWLDRRLIYIGMLFFFFMVCLFVPVMRSRLMSRKFLTLTMDGTVVLKPCVLKPLMRLCRLCYQTTLS